MPDKILYSDSPYCESLTYLTLVHPLKTRFYIKNPSSSYNQQSRGDKISTWLPHTRSSAEMCRTGKTLVTLPNEIISITRFTL